MSRSNIDGATSGAAAFPSIQLKFACCWLCLAALAPMFAYYLQNFRIVAWPIEISGFPAGRDFVNLWSGGRAALSGDYQLIFDAKRYALELQRLIDQSLPESALVWSYPPTAFWLGVPFAGLPFYAALPLWMVSGIGVAFWAFRLRGVRPVPLWQVPLLVLAPGVLMVLFFGQTGLLTSGLFIGGLVLARDRPWVAGALLAGFVVKPHMGLAIPIVLLALRHWRAFAATAVCSLLYVLATVMAFGTEPWDLYLGVTLPKHLGLLTPWGLRLPWMFTAQYFQFLGLGFSPAAAMRLHWIVAGGTIAALFFTLSRVRDPDLQITLAAAATLLISPYMQSYELALPAIAALRAAAYAPQPDRDPYLALRWFVVIVALMSPVIGLLTVASTGVNPVAALMLAIVAGGAVSAWPSAGDLSAWQFHHLRLRLLELMTSKRQS